MFISVSNAAEKFNISKRRVQILCEQGRIEGATMISGVWLIPADAKKPADARIKRVVPENQLTLFDLSNETSHDCLTLSEVCNVLSISTATAKNWIRLGKLSVEADGKTFNKRYVEKLLVEIKNGKDNRLKSRRNKKSVSGRALYKDYIICENNRTVVENILNSCRYISENEIRIIIAHFAIQLLCQSNKSIVQTNNWLCGSSQFSNCSVFNELIFDLLGDIDLTSFDLSNIEWIFKHQVQYIPTEDTLGFIYISLCDLNHRKQTGTYYTPAKTVNMLIQSLLECVNLENKTICDPCCGTGNFLIGLLNKGAEATSLYGQDIDEMSIFITRINMFMLNNDLTKEQLNSHFVCGNTLENAFEKIFSVVIGNPPWGYDYSREKIDYLLNNYHTAKIKGMESYDLFIEKGLRLLEENGYLAYVLPEALLSVASHIQARELILKTTSFKFISYLGNSFSGVQCPAIILGVQNDSSGTTRNCKVSIGDLKFIINRNRDMNADAFLLNMTDEEYDCLKVIDSIENVRYLAGNAKFALGIVTGNNEKYIKSTKEEGFEAVLKGSDILRYSIKNSHNYIRFTPDCFQQVAPTEIYRAKEKLLYRFISEVPVFTYDNQQTLSLNSCNILIPQIEGLNIKYILAVLNSSVVAYFIKKKFNSVKLLRSHIEAIPIPMVSMKVQEEITKKVDHLMELKESISGLYDELDDAIFGIYQLSERQKNIIKNALFDRASFLN